MKQVWADWADPIFLGFLTGPSVRVSRGNARAAWFVVKVNLGTSICIGLFFWILYLVLGRRVACLFTSDKQVVEEVSNLVVLLAFTVLLNSVQPVLLGVAIGSGRQGMVAWLNFVFYYVVGVSLGVGLAYIAHFGVKLRVKFGYHVCRDKDDHKYVSLAGQGIWIGMLIGSANWEEQMEKVSERMDTWFSRRTCPMGLLRRKGSAFRVKSG